MDYSLPRSSVHGISWARLLEWVAISFSSQLPYHRRKDENLGHGWICVRVLSVWWIVTVISSCFLASSSLKWFSNTWVVSWENYKCFIVSDMIFVTFVVVQLLSHVRLFVTPWTAAHQASLSFTISQSLLKLMSIESVMPSNHLILSSSSRPVFSLSQNQGLF